MLLDSCFIAGNMLFVSCFSVGNMLLLSCFIVVAEVERINIEFFFSFHTHQNV